MRLRARRYTRAPTQQLKCGRVRTTTLISTSVAAVKASAAKIIPAAIFLRGLKETQSQPGARSLCTAALYDLIQVRLEP